MPTQQLTNGEYSRVTKLVKPDYDSPVTDLIIDLEKLRTKIMGGSTDYDVFMEIKSIFHTLESIGSARIEGNNTTISDYLEAKFNGDIDADQIKNGKRRQGVREIQNIENAITFVEENVKDRAIDRAFISELHKIVVDGLDYLDGEGDKTPGVYRQSLVEIQNSNHRPIDWTLVPEYMEELLSFINKEDSPKYDLLKIAIVHHRFLWVHPFRNGNGRTARLITYTMLVKYGFNVNSFRILNPTAVFCSNRSEYYNNLAKADLQTNDGILAWCEYVLTGLKNEIKKVDKLADYDYLKSAILLPAIDRAYEKQIIKEMEMKILKSVVAKQKIVANDIKNLFHNKYNTEISRQLKYLIEKKMIEPLGPKARKYRLKLYNKYLLNAIIHFLGENDFLPEQN